MRPRLARALLLSAAILPFFARNGHAADPSILLRAEEVVYNSDTKIVTAEGHVEIDDAGRILMADSVSYDQQNDRVTASGHVSVMDANGDVAFADHVTLTGGLRDGALSGFGALIGKSGRLAAASAERIGGRYTIAHHAVYSPCKICNQPGQRTPVWDVRAERVVHDEAAHRIRFHNATFDMFGVPVLYTPYLSEPDPTVKYASGLLAPDIGSSTNFGYFARTPIYVALSDSNDLTLAPMFSTDGGEMMEAEYRARWNNGGMWLQGSGTYNGSGSLNSLGAAGSTQAQTYGHLFGSGRFALEDDWRSGFDLQLVSNNAYLKYYDLSLLDRLVNDLFIEKDSGRSRLRITSYYFQGLRAVDNAATIPFILPLIDYSLIPSRNVAGGQFRLNVDSAVASQETGPDSQRVSAELRWRRPFVFAGGQLWTIQADARGDLYHVDNDGLDTLDYPTVPTGSHYLSRAIPYIALDWRWPFVSHTRAGNSYVVQPIAQFIAQPYGGNPAGLPVEDASDFELDENNLLSLDRLPGFDLVESGPRANLGFRTEAIYPAGEIDALVGQTFRLKPDPVFAAYSGQSGTESDIVGRVSMKVPHFDLTDRVDIDHGNGTLRRHEVYFTGTYGRSAMQVSYVQLPPVATLGLGSREEINAQGDINFYENWQAFAAIRRDLLSNQFLDTEYGIGYEDECLAVSFAYRRKYTNDIQQGVPPSTSIILRFSLKTGELPITAFSLFPQDVFSNVHL